MKILPSASQVSSYQLISPDCTRERERHRNAAIQRSQNLVGYIALMGGLEDFRHLIAFILIS